LKPTFRLLFRSRDFAIGDGGEIAEGTFQNLDKDKELELVDRNDSFLYFDDLAYVSSPRPLLIFDFNRNTGKFHLANKKFSSFILREQNALIEKTSKARHTDSGRYLVNVFDIMLYYIYAGRERNGWKYYRDESIKKERDWTFHDEAKIKAIK
ncbi:MAG: hypothetical protein H0V90_03490, partial [Blastocatellia bacterium]|nr:hypothetical protein [Blastocatellia bacterium]